MQEGKVCCLENGNDFRGPDNFRNIKYLDSASYPASDPALVLS